MLDDEPAARSRGRRPAPRALMDVLDPSSTRGARASTAARCSRSCCSARFCGALGFWVTTFRLSYAAESLAHGMLPGLVLAALAGAAAAARRGRRASRPRRAGRARRPRRAVGADTATAVAVTGLLGLGGLLALAPEAPAAARGAAVRRPARRDRRRPDRGRGARLLGGAALVGAAPPARRASRSTPPAPRALGVRPGRGAARPALPARGRARRRRAGPRAACWCSPCSWRRRSRCARHCAQPGARVVAGGGAWPSLAGVAGIYASHHLGTAAGASVALALCAVAGVGAATAGGRPGPDATRGPAGCEARPRSARARRRRRRSSSRR